MQNMKIKTKYVLVKIRDFVISLMHYIIWILLMIFIFLSCKSDSGP